MFNIQKKSKKTPKLATSMPSADVVKGSGDIGTVNSAAGMFKGTDFSTLARLRAAKKKPTEEAQAPRKANAYTPETGNFNVETDANGMFKESGNSAKQKYLERLRKRAK